VAFAKSSSRFSYVCGRYSLGVWRNLSRAAFAGAGQGLRAREGFDKGPGGLKRPILKATVFFYVIVVGLS
jgi:hypothetical protein